MKSKKSKIRNEVKQIYDWLEKEIKNFGAYCPACGKCCDFESYGHKLYVSSPELLYFYENLKPLRKMSIGQCPYLEDNKCTAREFRFAGCRIFFCKGNSEKQNELSEQILNKFKKLCEDNNFPYQYLEISKALNEYIGI